MSYSEIQNRQVTVRKPHRCAWCAERINAGDPAQYRAYKFDGDLGSDWMHPECYSAMQRFPDQRDLLDGWTPGDFARGSVSDEPEQPISKEPKA